jgi:Uncharacterized protein conserved in bacteria (DUF2184)
MPAPEVVKSGKFLAAALAEYEPKLSETVYPELWGYEGKYHTAKADLPFAATKLVDGRIDYTGRAVNFGGKATTLPLANYGIEMDEYRTLQGVLAADWSWMELQAEEMARNNPYLPQTSVVENYTKALDRGLREWMHVRTLFGDASIGFRGLFNNGNVDVIDISTNLYGLTASQFYDFMRNECSKFRKASKLTAQATALLCSEDLRNLGTSRFGDNTSDGTPFNLLSKNSDSPSINAINSVNELDAATLEANGVLSPGTNKDFFVLYEQNEAVIDRRFADIRTFPPGLLDDQLTYRVVGLAATSEVRVKQPFRVRYYTYPKAS